MTWVKQKLVLSMMSVALLAPPAVGWEHHRQRPYDQQRLSDLFDDQETHLEHTDADVKQNVQDIKQNGKDLTALREQIEEWKDYALGFAGCLTLFVGIMKYLGRKGDQSA